MLADDVAEEGISYSIHVHTLQGDQHYHLTKAVHYRHDGVIAAVFRQVRDKVDLHLLPQDLWCWQPLVQTAQLAGVRLVVLTNIAVLTMPMYAIPHAWPVVPLSNHCISAVHTKMATCIIELMQY